jgi:hypothetical protein
VTRASRLSASRADLAALISMTLGPAAARGYRAAGRLAPRPRAAEVPDSAWHPATQLTTPTRRGTSNSNDRGSAEDRRRRKQFLLDTWGDGFTTRCEFCRCPLTWDTLTVDRFPIPGRLGGRYTRDNIRPACGACNSEDQGRAGVSAAKTGATA